MQGINTSYWKMYKFISLKNLNQVKIGIHSMQGWTFTKGMEVQEKEVQKDWSIQKSFSEKTLQVTGVF